MNAHQKARRRHLQDLPETALLKLETVLEHVPVSRATWFRGMKAGRFPQPRRIGNLTFWHARDIRYLINHGSKNRVHKQRVKKKPH
jgi:prophage regulatory protein